MKASRFHLILITALMLPAGNAAAENLITVYEQALAYDSGLAAARAVREAREAAVNESRAPLLPQLNAFAESAYTDRVTGDIDITTHEYGVRLNQPLFRANAWFGYQASQQQSKAAAAELSWRSRRSSSRWLSSTSTYFGPRTSLIPHAPRKQPFAASGSRPRSAMKSGWSRPRKWKKPVLVTMPANPSASPPRASWTLNARASHA